MPPLLLLALGGAVLLLGRPRILPSRPGRVEANGVRFHPRTGCLAERPGAFGGFLSLVERGACQGFSAAYVPPSEAPNVFGEVIDIDPPYGPPPSGKIFVPGVGFVPSSGAFSVPGQAGVMGEIIDVNPPYGPPGPAGLSGTVVGSPTVITFSPGS